ncbi:unnamed protein product, partial [Aureobasidium pullulans]
AAFHARYARPSPKSPAPRLPPTSSPALQPSLHARTPISKPQTADAGTQYTPKATLPPPTPLQARQLSSSAINDASPRDKPPRASCSLSHSRHVGSGCCRCFPECFSLALEKPRTQPDPNVKIMPLKYETCDPKDLGYLISNMLMELIRLNDKLPLNGRLTRFHSR